MRAFSCEQEEGREREERKGFRDDEEEKASFSLSLTSSGKSKEASPSIEVRPFINAF